jgi:hypothetical protein|tara:strand:+ start:13402 stop:13635 length:234 start_codon:yes stop_codon:yes gene_type:complete
MYTDNITAKNLRKLVRSSGIIYIAAASKDEVLHVEVTKGAAREMLNGFTDDEFTGFEISLYAQDSPLGAILYIDRSR